MRERALYKISVQFPLLLGANIYSCEKTDEESICTDLGPNQVQFIIIFTKFLTDILLNVIKLTL